MSGFQSRLSTENNDRAVAPVVGFILIFAMLIILLSMYQAMWVPIQNSEVEFDHYQNVKDDMTDVRSAIFEARTTGETQSTTVKLGTRYPNRLIAVNPPPSTGKLVTGEQRNISMEYQDGTEIDIPTQFSGISSLDEVYTQLLSYSPNYHELDTGAPIRHEHGLLYMDYNETAQGGGLVLHNDEQTLVRTYENSRNEVTIVPIQGNYTEQGVERVSIDPEPGILVTKEFEDINVTVPTDLSESTWEDILSDELQPEKVNVDEAAGELTLVLDGTWGVRWAPVGVAGTPFSGERGSVGSAINPASPADVRLVQADRQQDNDQWVVTFENQANTTNITEGRVNFYPGSAEKVEYINDPLATRDVNWNVGDDFKILDPPIQLEGNNQRTNITFGFDKVLGDDQWWVLTVIYETGEQGMYFIAEGGTATDGGGGSSPSVTIDDTTVVSSGVNDEVTVDFNGSDPDGNLDSYNVSIYNDTNEAEHIISSGDQAYAGGPESETLKFKRNGYNSPYWVVVTVTDTTGLSDSDSTQTGT